MAFIKKSFFVQKEIKAFLFLMKNFTISQKEAQKWIDKKRVKVNGEILVKKAALIKGNVEVSLYKPNPIGLKPIFQTEDFAIFDKPSGLLVHPKNRETPHSLTDEVRALFGKDANITHRIDRETSGIVLCSKNKEAEIYFKKAFENKEIKKGYLAFVKGKVEKELKIEAPILKNREFKDIKLKVTVDEKGKYSKTIIKPIRYFDEKDTTLIEATPITGRQHQIRAHMFHVKHPILGDPIYGVDFENAQKYLDKKMSEEERVKITGAKRVMLHAYWIEFSYKGIRYKIYSKMNFTSLL